MLLLLCFGKGEGKGKRGSGVETPSMREAGRELALWDAAGITALRCLSGFLLQAGHPFLAAYINSIYYIHFSFLKKTHLLQNSWLGSSFFGRNFPGGCQAAAPPAPTRALPLSQPGISSSIHFSTAWKSPRPQSHHAVMTSPGKKTPSISSEVTPEPCFETDFLFQTARLHHRALSICLVPSLAGPTPPIILSILSSMAAAWLYSYSSGWAALRAAQSQHTRLGLQDVGSLHFPGEFS